MCAQVTDFRMKLSDRMQVIADHVDPGETVADIGTDHGQIPVWLFARGISPRVILSDISEGSIRKAEETAAAYQFGEAMSFRTGYGLEVLGRGEADTVIIAGMGGKLIRQILDRDPEHTASFRKFIMQPRKGSNVWVEKCTVCFSAKRRACHRITFSCTQKKSKTPLRSIREKPEPLPNSHFEPFYRAMFHVKHCFFFYLYVEISSRVYYN